MSEIEIALRVAFRAVVAGQTTEAEGDAVLAAITTHAEQRAEAEAASRALHHRREARAKQLELTDLFSARRAA